VHSSPGPLHVRDRAISRLTPVDQLDLGVPGGFGRFALPELLHGADAVGIAVMRNAGSRFSKILRPRL